MSAIGLEGVEPLLVTKFDATPDVGGQPEITLAPGQPKGSSSLAHLPGLAIPLAHGARETLYRAAKPIVGLLGRPKDPE